MLALAESCLRDSNSHVSRLWLDRAVRLNDLDLSWIEALCIISLRDLFDRFEPTSPHSRIIGGGALRLPPACPDRARIGRGLPLSFWYYLEVEGLALFNLILQLLDPLIVLDEPVGRINLDHEFHVTFFVCSLHALFLVAVWEAQCCLALWISFISLHTG
jgi:hypothetical protein